MILAQLCEWAPTYDIHGVAANARFAEISNATPNEPQNLVTGGAGFIVALPQAGYSPLILDNLGNSDVRMLDRLATITGHRPEFIEDDVRDRAWLDGVFRTHPVAGVIHFAGLKAVGDSVADPLLYYDNNFNGTLVLAAAMQAAGV